MNQWLQLRPWQLDELRLYVGGPIPRKPSTNLLRRGLADEIPGRLFRLTEKGAGALAEASNQERKP